MGLLDAIRKEFIEVIEWTEPSDDILVYRFPVADNEIKNGAQLTVRESQEAIFIEQGQTADRFEPGRHVLSTANIPILTTLRSWPQGFTSPFKAEIYFFSLRQKLGQTWGTPQPITIRDKEFGSVQIRMFGVYAYHMADPALFYSKVSGTREIFLTEDLAVQLVPQIVAGAAQFFAQSNVPFLDMAANQLVLGQAIHKQLEPGFATLGVSLDSFVVQSITLPDALQKTLNERQSMGIIGNFADYARYQTARSIPDAAQNPGGLAGVGAGLAAGVAFGNVMTGTMGEALGRGPGGAGGGAPAAVAPSGPGAAGAAAAALAACAACGKEIDGGSAFCRHCGAAQSRTCPGCKAPAAADAAFCSKCGTKLA